MGRIRRGTLVVALVVPFVVGAVLATALGNVDGGQRELVVPERWRAAWSTGHVVEGDDVALGWGDLAGPDPASADPEVRFDPGVALARLEALHDLYTGEIGLGARQGPLAGRKVVVVVDGTWSQGPGSPQETASGPEVDPGGTSARGAVVDGVGLLRVPPAVLAPAAEDPAPSGGAPRAGASWELARGYAETVQLVTRAANPGHGLAPGSAETLLRAGSAWLASVAVPGRHGDVSEQVAAPQLAWGSARHGDAGWLLLQHLAARADRTLLRDLWTRSYDGEHVLAAYARISGSDVPGLNRQVAQYALRAAVADVDGTSREALSDLDPLVRAHRTTPVETDPDVPGHHRVTGVFAPAAYGYAVVRLVPDGSGSDIRVRVRGHAEALVGRHPGWSVGLVADGPGGARYGPVVEAEDAELRLAVREGEDEVYLVVAATPTEVPRSTPTRFAMTTRYPFEFRVEGATVDDPAVSETVPGGHRHAHGGGWVDDAAEVDPAAWVAPGAVVRAGAVVGPGVRLEGRARVESGAVLEGDVVVRDLGVVAGAARLSGDVVVGGDAVVSFTCAGGAYTSYRPGAECDEGALEPDVNGPVPPFAPEDLALSDAGATTTPPATPGPSSDPSAAGGTPSTTPPAGGAAPRPAPTREAPSRVSQAPAPPSGVAPPPAAVPAGACTASWTVVNSWPDGVQVAVTVTATTSGVGGWAVTWEQPPGLEITDLWGAALSRSGGTMRAENLSWNGAVPDGGAVTFGFVAVTSGEGSRAVPAVRCSRTG